MNYFVNNSIGLIIAFLNVCTFLLLIYFLLQLAGERRGKVFALMERTFGKVLEPLRNFLPDWGIDLAAVVMILILQLIAFTIKGGIF